MYKRYVRFNTGKTAHMIFLLIMWKKGTMMGSGLGSRGVGLKGFPTGQNVSSIYRDLGLGV